MRKQISDKIKELRKINKISQEELANELSVSRSSISSWETGRRSLSIEDAILISKKMDISLDNLLNPRTLNEEEYIEASRRFFKNKGMSFEKKKEVLFKIRDILCEVNGDEIIPMILNDSKH